MESKEKREPSVEVREALDWIFMEMNLDNKEGSVPLIDLKDPKGLLSRASKTDAS